MKKTTVAWIFSVAVLSASLIVSIVLGFTGYYSSVAFFNAKTDLVIGDTLLISVKPNESSAMSVTFDGAFLPNEKIPQVVQIEGMLLDKDAFVRVKAKVFGVNDEVDFNFTTTDHFTKDADGYYYFDGVLKGGNKITFCNYVVMPKENFFKSKERYILTFVVETLATSADVQNIWGKDMTIF